MAGRGLGLLFKTCCRVTARKWTPMKITQIPNNMLCSKSASSSLLATFDNELKLEYKALSEVPKFTSFETNIEGAAAVFKRTVGLEEVTVKIDANSSVQACSDELDELEDEEEDEPYYVPVFSVTVKKSSGDSMEFECSFDEHGEYTGKYAESGNAWNSMRIDSISVVPSNTGQVENVYSADCNILSNDLYSGFLDYLKERGIDETFATEMLSFYRAFEHQCYVHNFLEAAKKFCTTD